MAQPGTGPRAGGRRRTCRAPSMASVPVIRLDEGMARWRKSCGQYPSAWRLPFPVFANARDDVHLASSDSWNLKLNPVGLRCGYVCACRL
jgi:hypothetical protein